MTQEDKQLLLKDLCARLPYGVLCYYETSDTPETMFGKLTFNALKSFVTNKPLISEENQYKVYDYCVESIKPYLRPMSSMTKEECVEFKWLNDQCDNMPTYEYVPVENYRIFDWLNRHHFDYRCLIEKGLAIAVTEKNNPYKE